MQFLIASTAGFWRWPKIRALQDAKSSRAIKTSGGYE
jgi:hypothetical protein